MKNLKEEIQSVVDIFKSGDLLKAYFLRTQIPYAKTIGAIISERLFDIFSLCIIAGIGSAINSYNYWLLIIMALLIGLILFAKILSQIQISKKNKFYEKLKQIRDVIVNLIMHPRSAIRLLFTSLLLWLLVIYLIRLLFLGLDLSIPNYILMAIFPISIIAGLIPITVGGLGTRDTTFVLLCSMFGIAKEAAFIVNTI